MPVNASECQVPIISHSPILTQVAVKQFFAQSTGKFFFNICFVSNFIFIRGIDCIPNYKDKTQDIRLCLKYNCQLLKHLDHTHTE